MRIEKRLRLAASAEVTAGGEFEILAITAGEGNGWQFPAECLRASLSLWDGLETFVDHAWLGRSVRDLAGVCHQPEWDEDSLGVRLRLFPVEPSAPLLTALARQWAFRLTWCSPPAASRWRVSLKCFRLIWSWNPSRGGAFVRALNALYSDPKEVEKMTVDSKANAAPAASEISSSVQLSQENDEASTLCVRSEMSRYLLDAALAASCLPTAMQAHVRAGFVDRVFEPAEFQMAIEEARGLFSELTAPALVTGPGGQIS